ncbi:MAG: hypothetical protein H3C27_18440 [Opitutaceae bacterium]|nr:hypothetical protein [Opitutaceae bacterium]
MVQQGRTATKSGRDNAIGPVGATILVTPVLVAMMVWGFWPVLLSIFGIAVVIWCILNPWAVLVGVLLFVGCGPD